ncbi:MAG TPA: hypothetical protein VGF48_02750 [Thermoanaerobaculia bacterium]|jgi:hypothetical protein
MKRLLLLIALVVTTPVWAARWIVPAAASAAGASNTKWKTDLRLANPDASRSVSAKVYFLNAGSDNSALGTSITLDVPANGQVVLADVLASRFNVSSGTGALLVDAGLPLVVTSRTFNDTGSATFGQFVPGVAVDAATGETTHIVYLSKSAEYRTNVGFAGTTATAGNVTVTLFDANSLRLGAATFPIAPYGQVQVNDIFNAVGAAATAVARAEVSATVPIVAYGSVIDNRTGDPIAIMAQKRNAAAKEMTIPAVAHADGANNSVWRSDIRLFNPSQGSANVTVTYYPTSGASIARVITVGGLQTAVLEDIVASTFNQASGIGALRISSDRELLAASRTYNALPSGTFGQDVRAIPTSEAIQSNQVARLSGLTNDGYRTNLGLFNLGNSPLELTLQLRGAAGNSLATRAQRLEANQMVQLNDVFSILGVSSPTTGSLSIATTSGSGAYVAYASIVDNRSGDPVYVPASVVAAVTQGGDCAMVPFVSAGTVTKYRSVDGGGTVSSWVNTVVSDVATKFVSKDVVNTPGAPTVNIDTTVDLTVSNNLRHVSHAVSDARTNASGFAITIKTDMTFAPAMPTGPVPETQWCVGRTWDVPAIATTVVVTGSFPGPTTVVNRGATTGEILAIETLNTLAGPFQAVKLRTVQASSDDDVKYSIMWYSTQSGVFLRQENYSPSDALVTTMEVVP